MIICLEYLREGEGKEEETERREEGLFAPTYSVSLSGTQLVSLFPPPISCHLPVTKTELLVGRGVSDSFKNYHLCGALLQKSVRTRQTGEVSLNLNQVMCGFLSERY